MNLNEIVKSLHEFSDTDLVKLLDEVSNEVKNRNTIMKGMLDNSSPDIQKVDLKQSIQMIIDIMSGNKKL